ncbi:MAG TPA: hypothetical protein VF266_23830 [Thermoanaerobaculia bacterium]
MISFSHLLSVMHCAGIVLIALRAIMRHETRSGTPAIHERSAEAMNKNLSERLAEAGGAPVQLGERQVRALYELPCSEALSLGITFLESSAARPQALPMKIDGGTLEVNGASLKDVELWTDTAPPRFDVLVRAAKQRAVLKIWNQWRDERGTTQAWIGNAGIVVEERDREVILRCSDGVGAPTFDDLVVQLALKQ